MILNLLKTTIFLSLLYVGSYNIYGQNDCSKSKISQDFFNGLNNQESFKIISDNWGDYFGEDLDKKIPIKFSTSKIVSLKFDGLGCIYPSFFDESLRLSFINSKTPETFIYKNTFYNMVFLAKKNSFTDLCKVLEKNNEKEFADKLRNLFDENKNLSTLPSNLLFKFINLWNDHFLVTKINEINNIIRQNNIKNTYYYIYGFNVPYSLGQIQSNKVFEKIININLDNPTFIDNSLFVKVFWASGYRKNLELTSMNEITFKNQENYGTKTLFEYISNRAYLTGVTLRKILNHQNQIENTSIITHSHGSTLATTALIKTTSKLEKCNEKKNCTPISSNNSFQCITDFIAHEINTNPLPKNKIKCFLNAPSIPGFCTFKDIEISENQNNFHWIIGFNEKDKVLLKRKLPFPFSFIKFSDKFSSTTLGCNFNGDITASKSIFKTNGISENFIPVKTGTQQDHDFFCYMEQELFNTEFKNFIQK